jgi:bifunctional DNase/RNase
VPKGGAVIGGPSVVNGVLCYAHVGQQEAEMANKEMTIDSIRVSEMNYQRVIILKEKGRERYLPIWVGPPEGDAIAIKLQEVSLARPMTHDFACAVIDALGGSLESVVIHKLENDTFHAKMVVRAKEGQKEIDCRPSDAMAMAVRKSVPILADEEVLDKAGVVIE